MEKAYLTLKLSVVFIFLFFICLLINEGVISYFGVGVENKISKPQVRIYKANDCEANPPSMRAVPWIGIGGVDNINQYFDRLIDANIEMMLGYGGRIDENQWNFYSGCYSYYIDLSDFEYADLVDAEFKVFPTELPKLGEPNVITEPKLPAVINDEGNKLYRISVESDKEIQSIIIKVSNLLYRTGASEFGFGMPVNFLFSTYYVDGDPISTQSADHDGNYVGTNFGFLIPSASSQRLLSQYAGFGSPQQITQVYSSNFSNANRTISILLSTFLGLFIGAIFESILVIVTCNEIRNRIIPSVEKNIKKLYYSQEEKGTKLLGSSQEDKHNH